MSGMRFTTLAIAAILALSGSTAAVAWAAPEFEALQTIWHEGSEEEVIAVGTFDAAQVASEPIKMTIGGMNIKCGTATATAPVEGLSPALELTPTYTTCKANLFFQATIATGGCRFVVNSLEEAETEPFNAKADVSCPAEGSILVTVKNLAGTKTTCLIHVNPQTGLKGIKASNLPEANSITLKSEIESMQVVVTNGEEPCSLTPGTYSAKLTGNTAVTSTGSGITATPPPKGAPKPKVAKPTKFHFAYGLNEVWIRGVGTNEQIFSFDSIAFECAPEASETVTGSGGGKTSSLGGLVAYAVCQDELMGEVGVLTHECETNLNAELVQGARLAGRFVVDCPGGEAIEALFGKCVIKIPSQVGPTKLGHTRVSFENIGEKAGREVIAQLEVTGIEYEEGAGCKNANKKTANGQLKGTMKFQAEKPGGGEQTGLWAEKT